MADLNEIKENIRRISLNGKFDIDSIVLAKVTAVSGITIDCLPLDDAIGELKGVRLASQSHATNFIVVPAVNSIVGLIGDSDKNTTEYSCVLYGQISEIMLRGDQHGGLVKVSELVSKLNTIEDDLNDLKMIFSTWVTVPSDGGAALKALAATWYAATIVNTTVANLENDKVKHG